MSGRQYLHRAAKGVKKSSPPKVKKSRPSAKAKKSNRPNNKAKECYVLVEEIDMSQIVMSRRAREILTGQAEREPPFEAVPQEAAQPEGEPELVEMAEPEEPAEAVEMMELEGQAEFEYDDDSDGVLVIDESMESDVEELAEDSDSVIVLDDSSEDEQEQPAFDIQMEYPINVSSINLLLRLEPRKINALFPGYNALKVAEMRAFYANQHSVLQPFAMNEFFTSLDALDIVDQPQQWLDSSAINSYFNLIEGYAPDMIKCIKSNYVLAGPHIQAQICVPDSQRDYQLFSKSLLLMPVNCFNFHWFLIAINLPEKTIVVLDGLPRVHYGDLVSSVCYGVVNYLRREALALNNEYYAHRWSLWMKGSPQQTNEHDSGVYVCQYAWSLIQRMEPEFDPEDVPLIRQRMLYEYMNGALTTLYSAY